MRYTWLSLILTVLLAVALPLSAATSTGYTTPNFNLDTFSMGKDLGKSPGLVMIDIRYESVADTDSGESKFLVAREKIVPVDVGSGYFKVSTAALAGLMSKPMKWRNHWTDH